MHRSTCSPSTHSSTQEWASAARMAAGRRPRTSRTPITPSTACTTWTCRASSASTRASMGRRACTGSMFATASESTEMTAYSMTIGGKAVSSANTFNVLDPSDESIVAACPQGTPELVDRAVASALQALPAWAATADSERVAKLMAIADLIEKNHAELSQLITREQGKTQSGPGANLEVGGAAAWTRATASLSLPDEI